jgi:Fur family transcriptional regulator, zinc uptake regulator
VTPHSHAHPELTKNQALVYGALSQADGPLSAYTILDQLRDRGFRAPLQVYRALDKLREFGLVHRLESLNAFVACSDPACETHATTAFAICDNCGSVTEFADDRIARHLKSWAKAEDFGLRKTTIELRGICSSCQAATRAETGARN